MEKQLAEAPQPQEADRLMLKELRMECEPGFLDKPEYLAVLEELFAALRGRDISVSSINTERWRWRRLSDRENIKRRWNFRMKFLRK